jgi:hypothetical protein
MNLLPPQRGIRHNAPVPNESLRRDAFAYTIRKSCPACIAKGLLLLWEINPRQIAGDVLSQTFLIKFIHSLERRRRGLTMGRTQTPAYSSQQQQTDLGKNRRNKKSPSRAAFHFGPTAAAPKYIICKTRALAVFVEGLCVLYGQPSVEYFLHCIDFDTVPVHFVPSDFFYCNHCQTGIENLLQANVLLRRAHTGSATHLTTPLADIYHNIPQ